MDIIRRQVSFSSGEETLAGDLVLPAGQGPHPALLNIAGTGPQNRYGDVVTPSGEVVRHGRDRHVSDRLAHAGIAALCWDKRGVGESTGGVRSPGEPPGDRDQHASVMTDVEDAGNALHFLQNLPEIDGTRTVVMGHSAGVYFSCLLASRTDTPAAYVLWGGVYMGVEDLMEYIYEQVAQYAARGPDEEAWVQRYSLFTYTASQHWREILQAAKRGEDVFEVGEGDTFVRTHITRLKQELAFPLYEQFRNVKKPTLVIHGDRDLNVTHDEALKIAADLEKHGNENVTLVIVPGADHSMHVAPQDLDEETRMQERLSRGSYQHPYSEFFVNSLIGWVKDQCAQVS